MNAPREVPLFGPGPWFAVRLVSLTLALGLSAAYVVGLALALARGEAMPWPWYIAASGAVLVRLLTFWLQRGPWRRNPAKVTPPDSLVVLSIALMVGGGLALAFSVGMLQRGWNDDHPALFRVLLDGASIAMAWLSVTGGHMDARFGGELLDGSLARRAR